MPHISKEGYKYICIKQDGKTKSYLEHRWLMEQKLGRKLHTDEVVHHINENKLDNRLENLEIISRKDHSSHHAKEKELYTGVCSECQKSFVKDARDVRGNLKKGKVGPFCSRECAGRYSQKQQSAFRGGTNDNPETWIHGKLTTYEYRKCRCNLCKEAKRDTVRKQRENRKLKGE